MAGFARAVALSCIVFSALFVAVSYWTMMGLRDGGAYGFGFPHTAVWIHPTYSAFKIEWKNAAADLTWVIVPAFVIAVCWHYRKMIG